MTTTGTMDRERRAGLVVLSAAALFAVALLALSGCAAIRRQDVASTAQLLAAAGFQMRPANSPEQLRNLTTMPPFKIVARSQDGEVAYTFADPENCHCFYVGGPKEYSEYRRLVTERLTAQGRRWAEDAATNSGLWGGGWW